MDKNKTSTTASSTTDKSGEKKDENFLTKTAHSIRDKVHELTDDVKEKTHNLTHSSDAKKKKKDKDNKKTDTKSKTSSKTPTGAKKDSDSDSDDEDDSPKQTHPPSAVKRDNERGTDKSGASGSKTPPPSPSSPAAATEKKGTAPATRNLSDKPASRDAAKKSSDDHKDTAPTSSSLKPSDNNSTTKSSGAPSNKATGGDHATNKTSSGANSTHHIHISFDGVTTVDELLDRIDQTIEKAKIVVENGKGTIGLNIDRTTPAPIPTLADLDKKPIEKSEDDKNKKKEDKNTDEPILLNYNDIHTIEDILLKVNQQPGNRKVAFEHTSDDSGSITAEKQANPSTSPTSNENDISSGPPKSILKTSQDPSSLDTSTKVSSFQDDQIHVNIEDVQSLNDLLDRIDDAVQHVPVIIDTKSQGEKRQAPQVPNQNNNDNQPPQANTSTPNQNDDDNNQPAATPSAPIQKREAPKAPSSTNDQNNDSSPPNNKQEGDDKVPVIKVPEHEYQNNDDNKQPTSSSSTSEKQKNEGETDEWL